WSQYGRTHSGFGARATLAYTGSYRDTESSSSRSVAAWMPLDLQVRYRNASDNRWFGAVELTLNAVNVFNKVPPFVDWQYGYDYANFMPYGRVISLHLQKNWKGQ